MDRKHCGRCNSWVPAESARCPNCLATLPVLPDMVTIDVAPDGQQLAEYVAHQLDGVDDPRTRVSRLLAVRWDLERSIDTGAITYPHQIEHARSFIRTVDQQAENYRASVRAANRQESARWLRRGLACLAAGVVLTGIVYLAAGGVNAAYVVAGAAAVVLVTVTVAVALRFRPPVLPHPTRRPDRD